MRQKKKKTFVDNQTIFNRLDDKGTWISEWTKIIKNQYQKILLRN